MTTNRILILAESLDINNTSSGIVSSTFIASLAEEGFLVDCLYSKHKEENLFKAHSKISFTEVIIDDYKPSLVDRIPKVRALATYIYGYQLSFKYKISAWVKAIEDCIHNNTYDLIITLGSGSSFLPHYAMLSVNTDIPWLANFHDPYPMSVYPVPYKKELNHIFKKQENFTHRIIDKATYVSFPSLYLKDLMQEKYEFSDVKSRILPHLAYKLENIPKSDNDELIDVNSNKFTLLHAGTLLGPRKVEQLFEAFKEFIDKDEKRKQKSQLIVLGAVAREHKSVKDLIENYQDNMLVFDKRVSYKRSLELLQKSSVGLVIEAKAESSPFMPGKLADLIRLEKPILALTPQKSETLRILGENYPYGSPVDSKDSILQNIEQLWLLWEENKLVLPNSNKLKQYLSPRELSNQITKLIQN